MPPLILQRIKGLRKAGAQPDHRPPGGRKPDKMQEPYPNLNRIKDGREALDPPAKKQKTQVQSAASDIPSLARHQAKECLTDLNNKVEILSGVEFASLLARQFRAHLPYLVACAPTQHDSWVALDGTTAISFLAKKEETEGAVNPPKKTSEESLKRFWDLNLSQIEFYAAFGDHDPIFLGTKQTIFQAIHQGSILSSLASVNSLDFADEEDLISGFHIAAMRFSGQILPINQALGQKLFRSLINMPEAYSKVAVYAALMCIADPRPALLAALVHMGVGLHEEDEDGSTIAMSIKNVEDRGLRKEFSTAVKMNLGHSGR